MRDKNDPFASSVVKHHTPPESHVVLSYYHPVEVSAIGAVKSAEPPANSRPPGFPEQQGSGVHEAAICAVGCYLWFTGAHKLHVGLQGRFIRPIHSPRREQ